MEAESFQVLDLKYCEKLDYFFACRKLVSCGLRVSQLDNP